MKWKYQTTLPASWETCMQVRKQDLEPDLYSRPVQNWERSTSKLICQPDYLTYMQCTSCEMPNWIKHKLEGTNIAGRNVNNLRYADDTTLTAESKKDLKSLLMKVKEEHEKVGLKLKLQKIKIMASGPITSWEVDEETMERVTDFIFLGSKITADGNCGHEIERHLLPGRKAKRNLDSILKSRDIILSTNAHIVKAMVFLVVVYSCESWTIEKTEHQRFDAFELWCWRRLLRISWTTRRSNQSIL